MFTVSFIETVQAIHMKYRGNKICPDERTDERTNAADGQLENIIPDNTFAYTVQWRKHKITATDV